MANNVTQTNIIVGARKFINYITIVSDGSEETNLIVYDSSAVCAAAGIADNMKGSIEKINLSAMKTANAGSIWLDFNASPSVLALPFNIDANGTSSATFDFSEFGGLKNYAGTGRNGDIVLSTSGLDSGDRIVLVLEVRVS